ncbi:type II secretion system major pseudopilin GspG [Sulfitobacter sp. HNIBRBA2951]|uniref:type II secretion system major pseudopilin GspG n=1 Tax=Sulfitobacter aquimarinus TaxID=3158557 RepID=UPI0032E054AF
MKTRSINWTKRSGITILEVLIVLAIIAMIAAVVGPRLIGYLGRAKSETASLQIDQIGNALQLFYIDTGRYPTDAEGLSVLVNAPPGDSSWQGPYLDSADGLSDPWNRGYIYGEPGDNDRPTVSSLGRDGQTGGSGEDRDLGVQ